MGHNPKVSQLDAAQALKRVVETDHDAIRVVQVHDQEVSIEINAEDGDSVLALPKSVILSGESDCKDLRSVCVYHRGSGSLKLQVSPVDSGDVWATCASMAAGPEMACAKVDVIARRVRLMIDDGVEAHLVGQS